MGLLYGSKGLTGPKCLLGFERVGVGYSKGLAVEGTVSLRSLTMSAPGVKAFDEVVRLLVLKTKQ